MYYANGTYYTEEHSISFGDIVTRTSQGRTYRDFEDAFNTWRDWHLIPSSRPSVAHPTIITKFVEIPGADGALDLTEYLTGRANFGQRQGSFSFYVDNGHEYWENLRMKMATALHGKRMKMRLLDDPFCYYEGRFTVGNYESGAAYSSISISYQLDTYKYRTIEEGSLLTLWDPFNFETDYDYYTLMGDPITVNGTTKTYNIYAGDFAFTPTATWVSGNVTVSFGGVSATLNSSGSKKLGPASNGVNILSVSGTGSVRVIWRGGSL